MMGGASKLLMLLSTPFPLLYRRPSALRLARHSRLSSAALSTAAGASTRLPSSGPRRFSVRATKQIHTQTGVRDGLGDLTGSLTNHRASHPWPEWSKLVEHLMDGGYSVRRISVAAGGDDDDSFLALEDLPGEFVKAAEACLSFARDRPDLLRLLSKKDIEVIVENGSPFLFKNGVNSTRRMGLYLSGGETHVLESERAQTVDVIRYLLSYACNPSVTSDKNNIKATEITEASIRNLLNELVNVGGNVRESNFTESIPRLPPLRHEQLSRSPGQDIEMKRGDWICPKCSFMNFARNVKCLECKEGRPKRQLTGGEWECPQCDFFNYGRNMSCLRCDCNRPGESPPIAGAAPVTSSGFSRNPSFEQILNRNNTDKTEIERRLAANDEKAERWFSKVSQLDGESDLSRAAADEDFPEIMPLRKGENRFVVSTRKTPLERRLANAQYRGNLGNDGTAEGSGSDRTRESSINQSLDRILGRSSSTPGTTGENAAAGNRFKFSEYKQSAANQRSEDYVPFVPSPADMFSKSKASDNDTQRSPDKEDSSAVKFSQPSDSSISKISDGPTESKIDSEPSDAAERWSKKVAELDNVADLSSAIADEDFPEIMPMRKGENRFVVSKKKDRSLTSPQYKRRLALEQANNSNFVPFVPFPPDYFAKKDKQPEASPPAVQLENENSSATEQVPVVTEKLPETKPVDSKIGAAENMSQRSENWTNNNRSTDFSGKSSNGSRMGSVYGDPAANPAPASSYSWNNKDGASQLAENSQNANNSGKSSNGSRMGSVYGDPAANPAPASSYSWNNKDGASQPAENSQNASWKFSGKSLEGSAVKEPDPLDMSEEAKAERWFRRVAQIKDISELSQIPDEDFPEIMPMRKGVNRFVVSKRKTPLERRLTNPQYRRNLPIVSSEPEKDGSS